jgi:hypothetical protein
MIYLKSLLKKHPSKGEIESKEKMVIVMMMTGMKRMEKWGQKVEELFPLMKLLQSLIFNDNDWLSFYMP